jgi:hypothetical protein
VLFFQGYLSINIPIIKTPKKEHKLKKILIILSISLAFIFLLSYGCRPVPVPESGPVVDDPIVEDLDLETVPRQPEDTFDIDIEELDVQPLGEDVTTGDLVWNVLSAEDRGPGVVATDFIYEAQVGKIIVIEFMVTSSAVNERVLFDLEIIDDQGRIYSICLPAFGAIEPERVCVIQEIIPDMEYLFAAPFDVGLDSEGLILRVTDLQYPPEAEAYIDLGI